MKGKWKLVYGSLLLASSSLSVIVFSSSASAGPAKICTWTGASSSSYISVADNWSPNSGQSCGGTSTATSTANLGGAQLVFPATNSNGNFSLILDQSESVDDIVIQGGYGIGGSGIFTITPSSNSGIGIDATSATSSINADIVLGQLQTFEAASGAEVDLGQPISGSYSLTSGSPGNTGTVYLENTNSYSGGTTVASGVLQVGDPGGLGSGTVVVDSGSTLETRSPAGGGAVSPGNALTIAGTGASGTGGALEDYSGGDGWSGTITLIAGATVANESASKPFTITGSISGTGPLTTSGSGTIKVAAGSYSGGTIVSQGTLQNGSTAAIPNASLSVASGATYDLDGYSQSVTALTGIGRVTSSSGAPTLTVSVSSGNSDTIGTTLAGSLALSLGGGGSFSLSPPTASPNSYSGATTIFGGSSVQSGATNAIPKASALSISSASTFDLLGNSEQVPSLSGAGTVTSSTGIPTFAIDVPSGNDDSGWTGSITGSLGISVVGSGTFVLSSTNNTYSGPTDIVLGTLDVNGSISTSPVTVESTGTLQGFGTVPSISNSGVVHPGNSPGILTSSGTAVLGSGSLSIDIVGSIAGSGYSQLSTSASDIVLSGCTLVVTDSYQAPYGTQFAIVSGGHIVGSFANAPAGSTIVSGGRSLSVSYGSTYVVLTDITPATVGALGPVIPLPPSGALNYKGGSSSSPAGWITISNDQISLTAYGQGGIMLSQFGSDPVGSPNFTSNGEYFDVRVGQGSSFYSIVLVDCNLNGGNVLEWWNPLGNQGQGNWQPVYPPALYLPGSPQCLKMVFNQSSIPSLSQFSDAIFAIGSNTPPTPDGKGYWLVASDGGVFSFGDASFYGSMGGKTLNGPVVGMTATPDGKGYWLVASDGGVFSFGNAGFYGSMGGSVLSRPVLGITASPNGKGYGLVASDGGISSFGDATFHASVGLQFLFHHLVGMTATPDGKGYWLVASDGGVFSFGDATFYGSMGGKTLDKPVVGMANM